MTQVASSVPAMGFCTPPLVVPELVFTKHLFEVKLRLDEPLISSPDYRQLVALCAIADTLIERVQKLPKSAETFDIHVLQQIEALCKQVAPAKPAQDTLQQLGLLDTFPYLKQGLSGDKLEQAPQNPGSNYLNYISMLNQVVMMGTQLYHDACVPQHHKYTAHQIALLYQCLNMLQGETKPIRRLIEARFDEIKGITESKNPVLDMELSDWLQEITWLCREEVKACPAYIHKRLEPMMRTINAR
mmetsp:Transcript_23684/g.51987  ORF Transcript_23684/g.51987 Transcript_23684/m.51987 type:complete len:244 (-) Transcript_23684:1039-1770(-)